MHRLVALFSMLLTLTSSLAEAQPFERTLLDYPIVYVRCPRTQSWTATADVRVGGATETRSRTFDVSDGPDVMPEVTRFYGGFQARCDLMLQHPDGRQEVLYDCASRPDDGTCSAMDPAVSFDGRTVAFAVFEGRVRRDTQNVPATFFGEDASGPDIPIEWPNELLSANGAHLLKIDLETRETTEITPFSRGIWDSGPAWLSTGRIAFTSTRAGVYRTLVNGSGRASQIYTVDPDGENIEQASHHALASEQHPFQLLDGRVAYSSWQLFGMLAYRKNNGSVGRAGSTENLFHLYVQNPDGAEPFALYGQHLFNHPSDLTAHVAAHFITQTGDGRVWTGEYYRRNNDGLANILGFMPPPPGQEGFGPHELDALPVAYFHRSRYLYRPRDSLILAPWSARGNDLEAPAASPRLDHPNYDDTLRHVGKIGFPAAVPEGLLLSWGLGTCHIRTLARAAIPANSAVGRDEPACDLGIYRARSIPSASPNDLERIVDEREFHELMVRPVLPYRALFDVEQPAVIERAEVRDRGTPGLERGTPFGLLGASSLVHRETGHLGFTEEGVVPRAFAFQSHTQLGLRGGDLIAYGDEEVCGVRILGVMPNQREDEDEGNGSRLGERVVVLGEVPAQHYDETGDRRIDAMDNPDTSFLLRMPANTPYLMQGIDCDGRALNTDQTWQSLRPGEQKVCGGCHVHGGEGMPFEGTAASAEGFAFARLGEGSVPLMDGLDDDGRVRMRHVDGDSLAVEYRRDVRPILDRRCVSCHGPTDPAGDFRLDAEGRVIECVFGDRSQACVPEARRVPGHRDGTSALDWPNYSRYARFMNARGSLLYWKAVGARTDGLTDEMRSSDVDFGAAHPTDITPEELDTLAMWLELGGPVGERYLMDTQPPTLNVFGHVDEGAITSFSIGTADLGVGVDPTSLSVCRLPAGEPSDTCEAETSVDAESGAIVAVVLDAPVHERDVRWRFSVSDQAGNVRSFVRNADWFFRLSDGWDGVTVGPGPGDAGMGDAGTDDAGASTDGGGRDGASGEAPAPLEGGCGCATYAPRRADGLAWLLLLGLAAARRRLGRSGESTEA